MKQHSCSPEEFSETKSSCKNVSSTDQHQLTIPLILPDKSTSLLKNKTKQKPRRFKRQHTHTFLYGKASLPASIMPLVHLICIPSLCMGSRATAAFRYSALPCRYLAFEEHSSCSIIHVSNILSPSSDLWSDHFLCVARQLGKYPGVLLVSSLGGKNWPE